MTERRTLEGSVSMVGWVEVIYGCMHSGKSDELIRRIRRARFAKKTVQVFKPVVDDRRGTETVNTFNGDEFPATPIKESIEILREVRPGTDWVAIDEAQFLDDDLPDVCSRLARDGKRVMVAGLDTDFAGRPFGSIFELIGDAEQADKLTAHCSVCGGTASHTQRLKLVDGNWAPSHYDDDVVKVEGGPEEKYEARCRNCWEVPGRPDALADYEG